MTIAASEGGDPWSTRWTQENLHLLQQQDRKLAQEGLWAHSTEMPEAGGIVIATPKAQDILRSNRYWQVCRSLSLDTCNLEPYTSKLLHNARHVPVLNFWLFQ